MRGEGEGLGFYFLLPTISSTSTPYFCVLFLPNPLMAASSRGVLGSVFAISTSVFVCIMQ